MLVNGVDISMLEGWMLKINSNPSFFGKNLSRRWFKVGLAANGSAGRSDQQKLIISYSTNKTSKEPRGWLYVEDVSGVYCRRDMIEIVSPARTLRLKGETTAEHRLWSDSLYRLCNPPSTAASTPATYSAQVKAPAPQPPPVAEAKREDRRREERQAAAPVAEAKAARSEDRASSSRSVSAKETARQVSSRQQRHEEEEDDDGERSSDEEDEGERAGAHRGTKTSSRRVVDSPPRSARRKETEKRRYRSDSGSDSDRRGRGRESSRDDSDGDRESEDDDCDAKVSRSSSVDSDECHEDDNNRGVRPAVLSTRPSLLVASIKAASPCTPTAESAVVAAPQSPKFSEDEDEASSPKRFGAPRSVPKPRNEPIEEADDPQEESPRTGEQDVDPPVVDEVVDSTKRNNGEYFDSEEEEEEEGGDQPVKESSGSVIAPRSEVARDNNFADDDWDAEEDDNRVIKASASHTSKASSVPIGVGNVAADSGFASEDWDE